MTAPVLLLLGEHGALTTVELASMTKRTPRSVHAQLSKFAKDGFVIRSGDQPNATGAAGRPRKVWRLQEW